MADMTQPFKITKTLVSLDQSSAIIGDKWRIQNFPGGGRQPLS